MLQNKYNMVNVTNEVNHFGNDWGFYIDMEKIKTNFPPNHEILRKKYNLDYNNCCYEHCNDCCTTKNEDIPIRHNISITVQILKFILRCIPTFGMVVILTYIIIFVIKL
jgi:hypothetical protein